MDDLATRAFDARHLGLRKFVGELWDIPCPWQFHLDANVMFDGSPTGPYRSETDLVTEFVGFAAIIGDSVGD